MEKFPPTSWVRTSSGPAGPAPYSWSNHKLEGQILSRNLHISDEPLKPRLLVFWSQKSCFASAVWAWRLCVRVPNENLDTAAPALLAECSFITASVKVSPASLRFEQLQHWNLQLCLWSSKKKTFQICNACSSCMFHIMNPPPPYWRVGGYLLISRQTLVLLLLIFPNKPSCSSLEQSETRDLCVHDCFLTLMETRLGKLTNCFVFNWTFAE